MPQESEGDTQFAARIQQAPLFQSCSNSFSIHQISSNFYLSWLIGFRSDFPAATCDWPVTIQGTEWELQQLGFKNIRFVLDTNGIFDVDLWLIKKVWCFDLLPRFPSGIGQRYRMISRDCCHVLLIRLDFGNAAQMGYKSWPLDGTRWWPGRIVHKLTARLPAEESKTISDSSCISS